MRAMIVMTSLVWALTAAAQNTPKPAAEAKKADLTAEQVIEKSIEAGGGRQAMEKLSSTVAKGTVEMQAQGMHATIEFYAKAPNKRLIVTNIEGFGEIKQGFDGKVGWTEVPSRGVMELSGEQLAAAQRESTFNAALKWRELFPTAEMTGREKVGDRPVYVLRLTPVSGKPVTQYIDAETFMLLRQASSQDTQQGSMDISVDFSDYRDIGNGIKAPFLLKQTLPVGEVTIKMTEMKNNAEIDEAKFAKPAQQ